MDLLRLTDGSAPARSCFLIPSSCCRVLAAECADAFPSVLALPISFSDPHSSVSQMGHCGGQDFLRLACPEAKELRVLFPQRLSQA